MLFLLLFIYNYLLLFIFIIVQAKEGDTNINSFKQYTEKNVKRF